MGKINTDRKTLRKFGITMCVVFLIFAVSAALKQKHSPLPWYLLSGAFLCLAVLMPNSLKYLYIPWMKLAFILGWLNSRLLLILMFYLVFTPIGLIMRLFGTDILDKKIKQGSDSYWKKRKEGQGRRLSLERQF